MVVNREVQWQGDRPGLGWREHAEARSVRLGERGTFCSAVRHRKGDGVGN